MLDAGFPFAVVEAFCLASPLISVQIGGLVQMLGLSVLSMYMSRLVVCISAVCYSIPYYDECIVRESESVYSECVRVYIVLEYVGQVL